MQEQVAKIVEEGVSGTHLYLVEVEVRGRRIEVFLDGDAGVNLEECVRVNRLIHTKLEEQGVDVGQYIVDVSSPGIDRQLQTIRDYKKNVGRRLQVRNLQGKFIKGQLVYLDDTKIILQTGGGHKLKNEEILLEAIKEAIVVI